MRNLHGPHRGSERLAGSTRLHFFTAQPRPNQNVDTGIRTSQNVGTGMRNLHGPHRGSERLADSTHLHFFTAQPRPNQKVDTGTSECGHWDFKMWTLGRQNVDTGTSKCGH